MTDRAPSDDNKASGDPRFASIPSQREMDGRTAAMKSNARMVGWFANFLRRREAATHRNQSHGEDWNGLLP